MKAIKITLSILAATLVLTTCATAFAAELLHWTKAGEYVIEKEKQVITEDFSSITYEGLGKQARNDIIFVYYGDEINYTAAERAYENGEWKASIDLYQKAIDTCRKEWVQWYARLRMGQCYWYLGDTKDAINILLELNTKFPRNPFYPQVNTTLADIYIVTNKLDDASKLLREVTTRRNEFMVCWVETAEIAMGKLLIAQKNYRDAESHFKRIQTRLTYLDMKNEADFGLGNCLESKGLSESDPKAFKDAIKVYENIAANYNRNSLSKAYSFIARCYYNVKEYESAYMYGLRAGLLFIDDDGFKAVSAEGLYYAGKSLLALYHSEKDDAKKVDYGTNIILIRRLFETKLFGQAYAVKGLNELK